MEEFIFTTIILSFLPKFSEERPVVRKIPELSIHEDELINSPENMYMLSLRTRKKLPEKLHNSMMLFSFDPKFHPYVRMYLDWVQHCSDMDARREDFEKKCKFADQMIVGLIFFSGFSLVLLLGIKILYG